MLCLAAALAGCGIWGAPAPPPAPSPSATVGGAASSPTGATRWQAVRHWLYQLQNLDLDRAAASGFDLIVTDYSADGSEQRRYTREQIARLRAGPRGPRLVIAYLSIGEAEDYRYYWQPTWRPGRPDWLHPVNPQWRGNYPVEYWRPEWKRLLYGSPNAYLDKIIDAGFDGAYLDLIEAYELFESARPTARQEMVQLVQEIADYARTTRGKTDFGIIPQNGEPLIDLPGYLDVITGIAREDLYYGYSRDNAPSPPEFTARVESYLDRYVAAGKLVLTVDYTQRPEQVADAYRRARARGYVPYATVRGLDRMVINRGYDPE